MLSLSRKTFYAIEAVLFIAYNAKAEPIAGNALAEAQNLPSRYLEPMMQKLVRAGILRGVRGPQGGYMLGRERRNISLGDICDVIDHQRALPTTASTLGKAILSPTARRLVDQWQSMLQTVTLAQLCDQAEKAEISQSQATIHNFTI